MREALAAWRSQGSTGSAPWLAAADRLSGRRAAAAGGGARSALCSSRHSGPPPVGLSRQTIAATEERHLSQPVTRAHGGQCLQRAPLVTHRAAQRAARAHGGAGDVQVPLIRVRLTRPPSPLWRGTGDMQVLLGTHRVPLGRRLPLPQGTSSSP